MKITIAKKPLQKTIETAARAAQKKGTLPVLANVVLHASGKTVSAQATDMTLSTTVSAPADVKTGGSICVNAHALASIVKALPDVDVAVHLKGSQLHVEAGKSRFKLPTMNAEDFPRLPTFEGDYERVEGRALARLIAGTRPAMSTDDTRPHLVSTLLVADGGELKAVATDGHRLHTVTAPVALTLAEGAGLMVPGRIIGELAELAHAPDVGLGVAKGWLFVSAGDVVVSCKLGDDAFPPWKKVIPSDHGHDCILERAAVIEAVKRAAIIAPDKSGGIRLIFRAEALTVASENPDAGESAEEVDATFTGPECVVGVNARYFLEALSATNDDAVKVCVGKTNAEMSPVVIKGAGDGTDFVGVAMPMRI